MRTKSRVTTDNVGFLLAKAGQRFNELLTERLAERGYPEVRPSYGSVLVPLFEEGGLRLGDLDGRATRISLTGRGREVQYAAEDVLGQLDEAIVAALGDRRRDALIEALRGV